MLHLADVLRHYVGNRDGSSQRLCCDGLYCEEYRQEGYAGQEGHEVKTATDSP